MTTAAPRRLVIASNRLPVVLSRGEGGDWELEPGAGGLVSALQPVLRERGGVWVGWPGVEKGRFPDLEDLLRRATAGEPYEVKGVELTARERDDFYFGFSNQVIWPLFHDLLTQCNFDPAFWRTYQEVNARFARCIAREVREGDFLWIHDYHLMAVARELRKTGVEQATAFFLHIPFPPLDLFLTLPWRFEILASLLDFDLVGFQTSRDRTNFLDCVRYMIPDHEVEGDGRVVRLCLGGHVVRVGVFPISIDFEQFSTAAESHAVSERVAILRSETQGRKVILGVDRLDYSKGIPHKLQGYRRALERYPDLRGRVELVQLVVPSREDIPEYFEMKEEIERLVGEIQGQFTRTGWAPIHYQYGRWDPTELVSHYRAGDIALVTPLKDGMNLVAKEYCAAKPEGEGVLILSEYAGATSQLQDHALLVNPHDVEGVADAIHDAFTMPAPERRRRMRALREAVRTQDIDWWVETFLRAAADEDLGQWRGVVRYRPRVPGRPFNGSASPRGA